MDLINLLIADDHTPFRTGLRALLSSASEMHVLAEAATGRTVVAEAIRLQPDVILMDIQMADLNGIEATRQILSTSPHIAILILTMFDDDDFVFSALKAGARGYLLKGATKSEILRAIHAVASGEAIFGAAIARRVMNYFMEMHLPDSVPSYAFPNLTEREREVLNLIAAHMINAEIAENLGISLKTVRNHVSNIFSKLQVVDRAEAILRARDAGLGKQNF